MMDKERLRRADLITAVILILFGAWIIGDAFTMPMKDSWGGVMNVWYVSPALFPLTIGSAIVLLGILLFGIALKAVGVRQVMVHVTAFIDEKRQGRLISMPTMRFFAIVFLFLFFVYMNIPRVDFFISSLLFLIVFIVMFYIEDEAVFVRLAIFYFTGSMGFLFYFVLGFNAALTGRVPYPADILTVIFLVSYMVYAWRLVRGDAALRKRYAIGIIVAVSVPIILCPAFKYFLLVPLPCEGIVVTVMDEVYYTLF